MTATATRERIRRVTDLYVVGHVVELVDGSPVWMQALNPAERQEAIADSRAAAARVKITLLDPPKGQEMSGELAIVRSMFLEGGQEAAIDRMVEATSARRYLEILDELRTEEDWSDKVEWLSRADELVSTAGEAEVERLGALALEYAEEMKSRISLGDEAATAKYQSYDLDDLWDEYREWWCERQANERAFVEYRYCELWLSTRMCDAKRVASEGKSTDWAHAGCDHSVRMWEFKEEVTSLPEGLTNYLFGELAKFDISEREAKNSDRQGSSLESSPLPSAAGESTPSTLTEVSALPPGI